MEGGSVAGDDRLGERRKEGGLLEAIAIVGGGPERRMERCVCGCAREMTGRPGMSISLVDNGWTDVVGSDWSGEKRDWRVGAG